jgi:Holliday junction resolvase RusA-like endonuclease
VITFFVPGLPIAAGSKKAYPIRRANGRLGVAVSDMSAERGKNWRATVRLAAAAMIDQPLDGPLALTLTFILPRPKHHLGKKGLRPSAPHWPAVRPDLLKMTRAMEDALTTVAWLDDSQIVVEHLVKIFADDGAPVGVHVTIAAAGDPPTAHAGGRSRVQVDVDHDGHAVDTAEA